MKVLIVLPGLNGTGGVANYYKAVLPHLKSSRHVHTEYLEIGTQRSVGQCLHPVLDPLRFYLTLKKTRPDIVHINPTLNLKCYFRDGLLIKIAKSMKIPVMVFFRGWNPSMEARIENKLNIFFDQTYKQADHFIVLASRFRHKLQQWGVEAPIEIGTTAVDDAILSGFSVDQKISRITSSCQTKILFLSRVERDKGIFETIEALQILLKQGYRASLSIAGVGSASKDVQRYVGHHQDLKGRVQILGYVRDAEKRAVLQSHDILSLPTSHHEGLPVAMLEAMAVAMPVLTRPVGGIIDVFEQGKMGMFIHEKTPEAIAQGLAALIRDASNRIAIARYNHDYALRHCLASQAARNLVSSYSHLLVNRLSAQT